MNILLLLTTFLSLTTHAGMLSINPNRALIKPVELFEGYTHYNNGKVRVRGVRLDESIIREDNEYIEGGNTYYIEKEEFDFMHDLAIGVFRAKPSEGSNHAGTAFHVGGNLLLTNQHVFSVTRSNTTTCKSFAVYLNYNQNNKYIKCKEVLYCDKERDFCLIEMYGHNKGQALSKQEPLILNTEVEYDHQVPLYAIGNTRGYGIHGSKGLGMSYVSQIDFRFYAPLFAGNSGGPIINEEGEVIGLVKRQSMVLQNENSFNVGMTINEIVKELKKNLSDRPEILNQLNLKDKSVLEVSP